MLHIHKVKYNKRLIRTKYQCDTDNGRTPSATLSVPPPQEHGACRNRHTCTPHDTPVLYAPSGPEVIVGQRLSVLIRQ